MGKTSVASPKRPGRAEQARLICQLEDEIRREMFAQAGPRLEESPRLNLNLMNNPPRYDINIQIGAILMIFY